MSTDSPADAISPGMERTEIPTEPETREFPRPVEHGGAGSFLIRDADGSGEHGDPDLYQRLRHLWYDVVDDPSEQPVRVGTIDDRHGDEIAVMLRSSGWLAGETSDSPWYKYHLTLRPLDDDGDVDSGRTPLDATSLIVEPHLHGLVYKGSGDPFKAQHGAGSHVKVTSTWISHPEQFRDRAAKILDAALPDLDAERHLRDEQVPDDSKRFWKAEDHHRVNDDFRSDTVDVLRRSEDLVALEDGSLNSLEGERSAKHGWEIYGFTTSRFDLLGIDGLDELPPGAEIGIKIYLTDNPERVEFPLTEPKVETWLVTDSDAPKPRWDQWDQVHHALRSTLLTHLTWAGITADDLVADDRSLGSDAEPYQWDHPTNRREHLQQWYETRVPAVYREAGRTYRGRPNLTYDVLQVLRSEHGAYYDTLVERTGASYSAIQRQARRLEDLGIVERLPGQTKTLVTWSAPAMGRLADDALDESHPADSVDDRRERADERRREREQWHDTHDSPDDAADDVDASTSDDSDRSVDDDSDTVDDVDDDSSDDSGSSDRDTWRYLGQVGVTGEQLATALRRDHIDDRDVRVRVDASPIFGTG